MNGSIAGAAKVSLATTATAVANGSLACCKAPGPGKQDMTAQIDAIIEHYTKDGVTDVESLDKDANELKHQADAIGQKFETELHDPNVSQTELTEAAQQTLTAHRAAAIAEAAATKATQDDGKIDDVITRFADGNTITMDTLDKLQANALSVHDQTTKTLVACKKIFDDPKSAPADIEAASKLQQTAHDEDDIATKALGKAMAIYMAANPPAQEPTQGQAQPPVQAPVQAPAQY